jgi:methyl-accepting chemotaxis protein
LIGIINNGNKKEIVSVMQAISAGGLKTTSSPAKLSESNLSEAKAKANGNIKMAGVAMWFTLGITIAGALLGILLGVYLSLSITRPINKISVGLSEGSDQVANASTHVSISSQSLAEGASEQASGIEETSSSIEMKPFRRWQWGQKKWEKYRRPLRSNRKEWNRSTKPSSKWTMWSRRMQRARKNQLRPRRE